jgi:hypothetical protein
MVAGGGFYVSLDQTDSRSFGIFPVGVLLPKGSMLFPSHDFAVMTKIRTIFGRNVISLVERTALGRIIPFYNLYSRTWIVIHNATLLSKVTLAFRIPEFKVKFGVPDSEFSRRGDLLSSMHQLVNFSANVAPFVNSMLRHWSLVEFLGP